MLSFEEASLPGQPNCVNDSELKCGMNILSFSFQNEHATMIAERQTLMFLSLFFQPTVL